MNGEIKLPTEELPEGLSAAIDKLMANPQLVSMVASALGGTAKQASPSDTAPVFSDTNESQDVSPVQLDKLMPLIGMLSGTGTGAAHCKHEQLLCAIKPYLSPSRCQAIDSIIRISKMSSVIGQIKP